METLARRISLVTGNVRLIRFTLRSGIITAVLGTIAGLVCLVLIARTEPSSGEHHRRRIEPLP